MAPRRAVRSFGFATLVASLGCALHPAFSHDLRVAGPSPGSVRGASVNVTADDRIVVYGGEVQLWDPQRREWLYRSSNAPQPRRYWHTATELDGGRIVAIGGIDMADGYDRPHNALASVSIWDGTSRTWSLGPSLLTPRVAHAVARLPPNEVLVVGGSSTAHRGRAFGPFTPSVELVSDKTASPRASLSTPRAYHSASLLPDGRVLVVGGVDESGRALASAEIYDPKSDRWEVGPPLHAARSEHSATVLPDGTVLIVGGFDSNGDAVASVERWRADAWQSDGELATARGQHQAILLENGDLLIAGGARDLATDHAPSPVQALELRSASTGEWEHAGELPLGIRDLRAVLTHNGEVLVFGADPYGSMTLAWVPNEREDIAVSATTGGAIAALADGRFLLTGGHRRQETTASALIYDPATDRWTSTSPMHWPRADHRSIRLRDGRVLVLGGTITGAERNTSGSAEPKEYPAELWDPATDRWSMSQSLRYRSGSWAEPALLADGRVMLGATATQDPYSPVVHYFRIWDPEDDSVTAPTQVPRTRSAGQALYYADGHVLYLGGNDRIQMRADPRCMGELEDEEGAQSAPAIASPVDPCTITQESARDGRRLDWWDPNTRAWKELRPAELSLNGMEMRALNDGGVLAWKRPAPNQTDQASRSFLVWQPELGWRTLPAPQGMGAGTYFEPIALSKGELLLRMGELSWLWNVATSQWQSVAHDTRWGTELGTFLGSDGRLIAFRTRQSSEAGFPPLEAVWLNRASARWEPMAKGYVPRHSPSVITLADGRVMVAGGEVAIAQIWSPQDDTWRHAGYTTEILRSPTGLLLHDGRVMLTGVIAGHENTIACELWDPRALSWSACGQFPTDERLSRRPPVLRYLDEHQVLLVHGEQRALVWGSGQWVATRLQLPKNSGVPAPSAEGSPYLNPLASVWNPARNAWDDATDVLFWHGLGWHGYRTDGGDVIATSGALALFEWNASARTLTQMPLRGPAYDAKLDAVAATTDGCLLGWNNALDTDRRRLPSALLGDRKAGTWTPTSLAMQLPFDARAVALNDGTMLIVGEPRSNGSGVLHLRASCAGVEALTDIDPTYLPIRDADVTSSVPTANPTAIQPRKKLTFIESWNETWRDHWRGLRERVKSKIAFGLLLLFSIVRFFMNRWGEYHPDEAGVVMGRRIDIAVLCVAIPIAVMAFGLPIAALQIGLASLASIVAAVAATRLFVNAGEPRDKAVSAVPFAFAGAMAVWIVGTFVGDALYRTLRLLTDFS